MKKIHALDAVKIVFQADVAAAGLFFLLRLLQALVPTMQTLAVAAFVDRVTAAGAMGMQEKEILFLVLLLVALVAFSWISKSMTDLLE